MSKAEMNLKRTRLWRFAQYRADPLPTRCPVTKRGGKQPRVDLRALGEAQTIRGPFYLLRIPPKSWPRTLVVLDDQNRS
jgi:hypothetical protein